jgi:hypothetical protein
MSSDWRLHFASITMTLRANYKTAVDCPDERSMFSRRGHGIALAISAKLRALFRSNHMTDVILILITLVFYIVAWIYVHGCDHL